MKSSVWLISHLVTFNNFFFHYVTAIACRVVIGSPLQVGHGRSLIYSADLARIYSEFVSRNRRMRFGITPSKLICTEVYIIAAYHRHVNTVHVPVP
jgi:hypothetical protein